MVAIAIMGTVLSMATLSFNTWKKKANIESVIRGLYVDVADARTRAITQKVVHGVTFQSNAYVIKTYASAANYATETLAIANGTAVSNRAVAYTLTSNGTTTAFSSSTGAIVFDTTGLTTTANPKLTVVVNPITASPGVNCLVISVTQENLGRWNATTSKCVYN
jgi:Tfp pilus assembly protein FimT